MKLEINGYTEVELIRLLMRIIISNESDEEENKLVHHFNAICGHPAGSDLVFYPEDDADDSAEGINRTIKEWRAAEGLPGFKDK
ncbi:bacteriocin immunity protein [Pseudomonas sp. NPDC096950]|uniref:bacteriocin immunity protein n=1 Tax=Pseudomonas sp. NPDC096950 TaxID=3364485 RepID=UPI00383A077F